MLLFVTVAAVNAFIVLDTLGHVSPKKKKPCCSGKKSAISCHTRSSFLCTFTPSFLSFVAGLSGFRPVRTGVRPAFARPQAKNMETFSSLWKKNRIYRSNDKLLFLCPLFCNQRNACAAVISPDSVRIF